MSYGTGRVFAAILWILGLFDHQGTVIPIHGLRFADESGRSVMIDSYFHPGTPVVLALVYYECHGACGVVLSELFGELKRSGLMPGRAFEAVAVSVDPGEKPALAAEKRATYLKAFGLSAATPGYHFLTGEFSQISKLSSELGFPIERKSGNAHPSVLFFLSPEGRLTQTSSNIQATSRGFRSSLARAALGGSGDYLDRMISICRKSLAARKPNSI